MSLGVFAHVAVMTFRMQRQGTEWWVMSRAMVLATVQEGSTRGRARLLCHAVWPPLSQGPCPHRWAILPTRSATPATRCTSRCLRWPCVLPQGLLWEGLCTLVLLVVVLVVVVVVLLLVVLVLVLMLVLVLVLVVAVVVVVEWAIAILTWALPPLLLVLNQLVLELELEEEEEEEEEGARVAAVGR